MLTQGHLTKQDEVTVFHVLVEPAADKMDTDSGFADLLQQAQQLNANMDTGEALPRVERNLVQIRETASKMAYKAPYCGLESTDVKA